MGVSSTIGGIFFAILLAFRTSVRCVFQGSAVWKNANRELFHPQACERQSTTISNNAQVKMYERLDVIREHRRLRGLS